MFGVVIAFKDYTYARGVLGSSWAGFKHFEFFFTSNDAVRILRNTILYSLANLLIVGLFLGMLLALMLYEVRSRVANKIYQTTMLVPHFLSWVVIAGIALLFLNPKTGLVNSFLTMLGGEKVAWYSEAQHWPFILMFFAIWKDAGMASLYFYAALLSIDTSLFEAASLDGAGRLRQIWYISIPCLKPMAAITLITRLGHILGAELGLFYQIPMDSGALYPTTDVIATYLYRGLEGGAISATAAVGLFQSVVGLILVLVSNAIIKRIDAENAMF
jgi:putative aldouronate transport system permease protein